MFFARFLEMLPGMLPMCYLYVTCMLPVCYQEATSRREQTGAAGSRWVLPGAAGSRWVLPGDTTSRQEAAIGSRHQPPGASRSCRGHVCSVGTRESGQQTAAF